MNPLLVGMVVLAYLLGSIPFGLLIGLSLGIDLRKVGSGNIGATNVYRSLGFWWALVVFTLDTLKGVGPVILPTAIPGWSEVVVVICGLAVILGHSFPVWTGFRGGRAVATALGVAIGIFPVLAGIAFGIWLGIFALTRYVSLASIVAVICFASLVSLTHQAWLYQVLFWVLIGLIVIRHIPNIRRLIHGQELKIGKEVKSDR